MLTKKLENVRYDYEVLPSITTKIYNTVCLADKVK